ncbi:hypothetical protein C8R43DRAFT_893465, partial [Mycena crocata]
MDLGDKDADESVPLGKQDGEFVGSSSVDDYRYRPTVYENLSVYEWTQCYNKKIRTKKEREQFKEDLRISRYLRADYHLAALNRLEEDGVDLYEDTSDVPIYDEPPEVDSDYNYIPPKADSIPDSGYDDESDWNTDDEDDVIVTKQKKLDKSRKPARHAFHPKHPLFPSHSVTCDFTRLNNIIPNFIGAMPRADKGDRSYYCITMLTMFKPWRTPSDLKDDISTWSQAFNDHPFTERELQLMENFNTRYECNDARDDHYSQMRKK